MHVTSNPLDWYAARAAGVAAYALLSFVVVLGLTMARKTKLARWPKFAIEDVHRFAGLLVGVFVVLHVVTIALDAWLPFSVASIIVPFVARYRPVWVACGVVSAELLLALAVTNHYRDRLTHRFWRRAHYLNFAVWGLATIHGIATGTDRSATWLLAVYGVATASVGAATVARVGRGRIGGRASLGLAAAAGPALAALVLGLGVSSFPFAPKPWNAVSFTEPLTGHLAQLSGFTRGIISVAGEGSGTQRVLVRADLLFRPHKLERTAFQMEYLPSGLRCTGTVTRVHAFGFAAVCRVPEGGRRVITATWPNSGTSEIVDGTISSHP